MLGLFNEIKDDLKIVEKELHEVVKAPDALITEASTHLLNAGGKRLRPAFCLLGGKFYNYSLKKLLPLAVALELIHMATLVHDDVVDDSVTRRGLPTVKAKWGNKIAVHIGDYLLAKSLILISTYKEPIVSRVMADTSVMMSEGEIQQISSSYNVNQYLKDYFYRIKRKTALLISASCQLGAAACGAPKEIYLPLKRYGHYTGMAFQITDDILDMVADQRKLGKPIGGDLHQGIITLPVIYALNNSPKKERLKKLITKKDKSENEVFEAIDIIKECGGIEYSFDIAEKYINKAKIQLAKLPDKQVKATLDLAAEFIRFRKF
ncbi:polyprenyl synthetase family protein [Desulfolucanica intricata]|uniref:polyprenyl synthetase family protein n=1 Tax=Desulfolucanica intricata TaxID=1285191 RepID=UPI000830A3B7|nr:polyprenyl synthetase family protein [Desulfolucanica intricata]